jgi:AraC-like DNA-binding protein
MYQERPSRVPGAVLWWRTRTTDAPLRVLPDGCIDVVWSAEGLFIAGPDTTAQVMVGQPGARYTGVRFAPGTGPLFAGVPAHELRDQRVALADLWPAKRVRKLTGHVAGATDPRAALEEIAGAGLTGAPDPLIAGIVAELRAGASVAATAESVGLNARGLHRRSLAAFGYGPKTLARILRMNRALDLARAGTPFATVAVTAGYADQAHLARDVRALAGVPLTYLCGSAA